MIPFLLLRAWLCVLCCLVFLTGCAQQPSRNPIPTATTDWLTVTAGPRDDPVAKDVAEALQANQAAVCEQLQVECGFPVSVELYASQADFDDHVMNPAFSGYYAVSGQGKIQMVSPRVPPPGRDIPYEDRVQIAVHEFAHLALDQIDPDLPDWLDEGSAVYLAPHALYDQACQQAFAVENVPRLQNLMQSYSSVQAADFYAYTLIRFIVERDGLSMLNTLLRSPAKREVYIQQFPGGLETAWRAFLERACSGPGTPTAGKQRTPAPQQTATQISPSFITQTCWFEIPQGANVTCGTVAVPENRTQALTPANTIRLAVAVFHSACDTPAPDPVFYHVGGPGGHMLNIVPIHLYEKVIVPFLKTRDLVLFDPRGTGFSEPALECSPGEDAGDCVRRLFTEGHNLYAYNSSSMAADLQDIRRALGYDRWNLVGESYGTHVAQIAMREQPDGLRSVILDAVVPVVLPDLPGGQSEFELSLGRLFARCHQDPACDTAYPDLPGQLDRAVRRLNAQPAALSFDLNGKRQSASLSGDMLKNRVMTALYEAEMIPYLPYAISEAAGTASRALAPLDAAGTASRALAPLDAADGSSYEFWDYTEQWEINLSAILSRGAHWAVLCGDGRISGCEDWPVAVEQLPVASAIPALLLSGEFDPVTPPEYGREVARRLPNSFVVEFPGFGHWANGTGHPCPVRIIQAFLDDPLHLPDTDCTRNMQNIPFYIPKPGP